ncbi:armadillo-type protein [Mycena sp. CBHHK59/15]|nr:armadillo-type protein [Mycena sp. CBHHK59/15]
MNSSSSSPPQSGYAANEDEAEAGSRVPVLPRSKTMNKEKPTGIADGSPGTDADGPFSHYCTDNAPIWKLYMDQAKISDDNLANIFNSDLDPLLIFAGLFSAILSAFLIEIRKGLQEDLQNITNTLLTVLIENQHNATGPRIPSSTRFEPSSSSRWVNGLWFLSLMFSLMSALGASLAKGWVTQFSSAVSGSSWGDAAVHCSRFRGLKRWHLKLIIQSLPILIHIAFFFFSVGLVILVFQDDTAIGVVILVLTVLIVLLYIGSSIHPAYSSDSPFRTPVSGMIRRLLSGSWRLDEFAAFPARKDAQKAQALTWLLTESPNVGTINAAIRAMAGLPANPAVQDELLHSATAALLSRTLSSELAKASPDADSLSSSLYAIFHLVQAAPADAEDTISPDVLRALVNPGGALSVTDSMPAGIREIALCVKARIWLFLWDHAPETTLFDTDIPVLMKSCADGHLRWLLFEVHLLAGPPAKATDRSPLNEPPHPFLAILRDPDSANRNEVHEELVKAAMSERYLTETVVKFGALTLLEGLTAGSTELRRRYAKLFSELATDEPSFIREMTMNGTEKEFCALLRAEDDEVRMHVVNALKQLAVHDNGRKIITGGFPAIIESLRDRNPPIFSTITRFLADVACYDDIRKMIAKSDILTLIITATEGEDEEGSKIAVQIVREWAGHDDIRTATTAATIVNYLVGLICMNHPNERAMKCIVALARHDDIRVAISAPETLQKIMTMLGDPDSDVRRLALKTVDALAHHDDVRAVILTLDTIQKIMTMLGDPQWMVQQSALKIVEALAHHDDVRAVLSTPETIQKIMMMLGDPQWVVRQSALKTVDGLVHHDDVRTAISTPETIQKIITLLGDPDSYVRQLALKTVDALAHHDDVRAAILMLDTIQKIIKLPGDLDSDVRELALKTVDALAHHDDVRAAILTPETIQKIIMLLGDPDSNVRQLALKTVDALANHDDVRAVMSAPETIQKIIMLLGDPEWHARAWALMTVDALAHHDDIRAVLSMPETIQKIITLLGDLDLNVRTLALKTVDALANHDDVRAVILTPDTIQKIMTMLGDPQWMVQESALKIVEALAHHDDVRAVILTPDTIQKIMTMLGDPQWMVQGSALKIVEALAHHDDVRAVILTPDTIQKIVTLLGDPDSDVRRLALETVDALSHHDDVCAAILMPDTIQKIMTMLGDPQWMVQQSALKIVEALAHHGEIAY